MKKANLTTNERGVVWGYLRYLTVPLIVTLLSIVSNVAMAQPSCTMTCIDVQVSLDQDCEATVTYDMVSDPVDCNGPFTVELFYDQAMTDPVPSSPEVNQDHIDMTLYVRVTNLGGGGNNSCWSTILVEDKLAPYADCDDVTMACTDLTYYPGPDFTDNCTDDYLIDVELFNETVTTLNCDEDYIKKVVRTWKATDASGNMGFCDQTIYLERIDTSGVMFPEDLTVQNGNALSCDGDYDLDGDGVPDPEITGVPTLYGQPLYPTPDIYCNVLVTFDDNPFPPLGCVEKIMRVWQVREWWCSTEIILTMPQIIEIVDDEGPEIVCPPDFTMSTDGGQDCLTNAFLPPATVSDECNDVLEVDVSWDGGFLNNQNGGYAELPVGWNTITYTAYDNCYNSSSCTMQVHVVDETPPVAVCDQYTAVSLTSDGTARVYAETFDDGSHDECGIESFEVRRMDPGCGYLNYFGPYVELSCCDIADNPIMVVMRVTDISGNSNECMVEVTVQDKLPALVVCPPNITISCEFPYDMNDLSIFGTVRELDSLSQINNPATDPRDSIILDDIGNPYTSGPSFYGLDGYAYDNCEVTVTVQEYEDLEQCGEGKIYRTFTAEGPGGPSTSCTQVITIKNYDPFNGETDILWPNDTTITGGCSLDDIDPDITGRPIVDEDACDQVAISQPDDWIFNFDDPNEPGCYKVLRKWKVIDWCDFRDGQYTIYEHQQVIKVINNGAPEITDGCDDVSICSYDNQCANAFIDLEILATDDCTPFEDLDITYDIDAFNDGTFDFDESFNPLADPGNGPNMASGTYPVGEHRIVWTVEDLCGNRTTCEYLFEIVNCKAPNAICQNGLSAELMPMDLDGDGDADWAMIELKAEFFDAGSNHPCYDDVTLSFSSDITDTVMMYDCEDLGEQLVQLWVTAENGEQAFCNTFVDIQDNNMVCPDPGPSNGNISGAIYTPEDDMVPDVMVDLLGDPGQPSMTNEQGQYVFGPMPYGGSYTVDPSKNDDMLNGVTTYDLALLQRHILDLEPITDPYKLIAADVDMSQAIDVLDLVELRRVILGLQDVLMDNESWRFIDADYVFATSDPLSEPFGEEYRISPFQQSMHSVDFKGVKIGDLNGSVDVDDTRGFASTFLLNAERTYLSEGETMTMEITPVEAEQLISMQYTLQFDPSSVTIEKFNSGLLEISDDQLNREDADRGLISFAWNTTEFIDMKEGDVLFTIDIKANRNVDLSTALSIGSGITQPEAYTSAGAEYVDMIFSDQTEESFSFELYQNRPNPFNGQTIIGFRLPEADNVTLSIIDYTGKVIRQVEGPSAKGYNEIRIDSRDLGAEGILYYRLDTKDYSATKKMIVLP